ncbi:MAG: hypothetical protein U9R34_03560 [Nanoarchaeota archaeon]|nr:hypothetical protein [Nanoarchaeota archaeon]
MISISNILLHYKRKEIQEAMLVNAKNREVSIRYANGGFGKRPDIIQYPSDVMEFVKSGASSFHVSEERWSNPLLLSPEMKKKEQEDLRIGWDFIIDIDCPVFEYSRIIAYLIVKALKRYGINAVSCKFSGNKGFHVAVPFESFPEKVSVKGEMKEIRLLFPESTRRIADFLGNQIDSKERGYELSSMVLEHDGVDEVAAKMGKKKEEMFKTVCKKCESEIKKEYRNFDIKAICPNCETENIIPPNLKDNFVSCTGCGRIVRYEEETQEHRCLRCGSLEFVQKFDNSSILEIDSVLISSRHLYRMVYSLHEKSGLASVPVDIDHILDFTKDDARPEIVKVGELKFLDISKCRPNEAGKLIQESFDDDPLIEVEEVSLSKEYKVPTSAIPQEFFPPCMKKILNGMKDGKKRALFSLLNFLDSLGWGYDDIAKLVREWNELNEDQLREVYLNGQLKHQKQKKKHMLPQNCKGYYEDLQVCFPDAICRKVKNPVNYAQVKVWIKNREKDKNNKPPKEKPDLTKEQEDFIKKKKEQQKEFKKKMKEKVEVKEDSDKDKKQPKGKPILTKEQEDFIKKRKEAEKEFRDRAKEKVEVKKGS